MEKEQVEEFILHFDKNEIENQFLKMEEAIGQNTPDKVDVVQSMFREIHSMKGTAAILKIDPLKNFLHIYEESLGVISRKIHQLVGIKRDDVFDFFLRGLDLVERVAFALREDPKSILKNNKELFNFYIQVIVEAKNLVKYQDDYFEFAVLDEELF